jgi:ribosomal protein S18 acetylase RimI-like enzyme
MTGGPSNNPAADGRLIVETEPDVEDIRFLEDGLIDFNIQATGITDGSFIGIFLRAADGSRAGGLYGWVWGSTCYVRYLFVAESMRGQGQGTRLMRAVEAEAKARNCRQIVLETHSFQAPGFYRKLGFDVVGRVEGYPRDHQYLTLVKPLD